MNIFTLLKKVSFCLVFTLPFLVLGQVGIGTTTPNSDALLDIDASSISGGLLLPRMALSSTSNTSPLSAHVAGMVIYNTATASDVTPGYYYNDGSRWVRVESADNDKWDIEGNSGTNTSSNFIGTVDNVGLRFRTNNTERLEITNDGRILATESGSASAPLFAWSGDPDKGFYSAGANQFGIVTNGTERLRIPNADAVRAMANGSNGTPFYSWNDDTDLGIWRSNTDRLNISAGGREMVEFRENGANSVVTFNDGSTNSDFRIESDNEQNMFFVDGGQNAVGIGTNTPAGALDLTSSTNGFVPPRVELTSITTAAPVVNPQGGGLVAGTTVYNTNTAGTAPNNVAPGLYYWDGSRWVAYAGSPGGLDWTLTGNSGTTPFTNYLGTTDAVPLVVSTDATPRYLVNPGNGELYLNSFNFFGSYSYIGGDIFQSYATGSQTAVAGYSDNAAGYSSWFQNIGGGLASRMVTTGTSSVVSTSSNAIGNGIQAGGSNSGFYSFATAGSGGVFSGEWGSVGIGTAATGTGIAGMGQNRTTIITDPNGSGMAASGNTLGIFAYAGLGDVDNANRGNAAGEFSLDADDNSTTNTGNNGNRARAKLAGFDNVTPDGIQTNRDSYYGGYFSGGSESSGTPSYAYVGMRYRTNANGNGTASGGQDYKVIGTGSNSTLIDGPNGEPRIMFSPEAPEILFQDFGVGQLKNGIARIELDDILKSAIYVDNKHPLKVFITLEGECNGVFVTNKSADGFTVKELQSGNSNAPFSWQIVASRADRVAADGTMVSKHVGVRLPVGPGPVQEKEYKVSEVVQTKIDGDSKIKNAKEFNSTQTAGDTPKE